MLNIESLDKAFNNEEILVLEDNNIKVELSKCFEVIQDSITRKIKTDISYKLEYFKNNKSLKVAFYNSYDKLLEIVNTKIFKGVKNDKAKN